MGTPILVVEDDPDIRSTLKMVLLDEGYEINEARNGQEALQVLHTSPRPQVVLLDYLLPVMDGVEVLRQVEQDPHLKKHAYLCITARTRFPDAEAEQLFAALDVPILFKPFELEELLKAVAEAANRLPPEEPPVG